MRWGAGYNSWLVVVVRKQELLSFICFKDIIYILLSVINNTTNACTGEGTVNAQVLQGTRRNFEKLANLFRFEPFTSRLSLLPWIKKCILTACNYLPIRFALLWGLYKRKQELVIKRVTGVTGTHLKPLPALRKKFKKSLKKINSTYILTIFGAVIIL